MAENAEKSYWDKLDEATGTNSKAGFKYAKEASLGKGFISAIKSVTGYDLDSVDGAVPDGTNIGGRKGGNEIKSPNTPDQTAARSTALDQPFTIVNTNNSKLSKSISSIPSLN